jgi:hypothetical protein
MPTGIQPHLGDLVKTQDIHAADLYAPLEELLGKAPQLHAHQLTSRGYPYSPRTLHRFHYIGPEGGDGYTRLGIFAGIHGDEVAGSLAAVRFLQELALESHRAQGYEFFIYPVCNPTGYADGTRHSRSGLDLNREFWKDSDQPEVRLLEQEILQLNFNGFLSLHADDTSDGLYGFALGHTHAEYVLSPALEAASRVLPRNRRRRIDNFPAENSIVRNRYPGMLGPHPDTRRQPFEIVLETPALAPIPDQVESTVIALHKILEEYRNLLSFSPNL